MDFNQLLRKDKNSNNGQCEPPRPKTSEVKLTWIHLRYYPPGLILEYLNEKTKKTREKTIDLLHLHSRSKLDSVVENIMKNEPLLTAYNKPTLIHCLEKLKARCKHDYSKRFTSDNALIRGHSMPIIGACISRNGDKCATVGFDKTCKLWDSTGREIQSLTGHYDAVCCVSFDSAGEKVLTGSYDGTLRLWKVGDELSESIYTLQGPSGEILSMKFSADCFLCATGTSNRSARVFDLTNGVAMYTFTGHDAGINNVSFDRTCTTLLTGSFDGKLGLWDLRSGTLADYLKGHKAEVTRCSFNFAGDKVVSSSLDNTVRLWDVRSTNDSLAVLTDNTDEVIDVQFNYSGSVLASACRNGKVIIWDALTGSNLCNFQAHNGSVNQVSFSPSGGFLLTCGEDNTAKIWHSEFGDCLQTLSGHSDSVFYATFNYFGDVILTVSKDNTAQFWR